jgi:hypothetical protein
VLESKSYGFFSYKYIRKYKENRIILICTYFFSPADTTEKRNKLGTSKAVKITKQIKE